MNVCKGVWVTYDTVARQLVLTQTATGNPVRVLEGDLNATTYVFWSPGCQFRHRPG